MLPVPDDLRKLLEQHQQAHVLQWWDQGTDAQRQQLLAQLRRLNLSQLRALYQRRETVYQLPRPEAIQPVPVIPAGAPSNPQARQRGEEALRRGEVAALVVAGGQGSRLGFDHPKGMFPIGPVSDKPLFQMHAEKVLAVRRRYGRPVPFLIMTSPATHDETLLFFKGRSYFGLPTQEVHFFEQGTMPALDLATGKLLLEAKDRLFLSPDGHGGTLTALADSGLLAHLLQQGIKQLFYFQVDNPLVKVADPTFLGHHLQARAEVSSRVIPKNGPTDKLGNFVQVDGRCTIIEYSDLPGELARQTDPNGRLRLWAGSPAIHYFDLRFLEKVMKSADRIPFHVARKKVPHLDDSGNFIHPQEENALKFERFIFDVLPLADRWTVVETSREEEFAPLKNATGPDSPAEVRQAIAHLAGKWLTESGTSVPSNAAGQPAFPLEISPLFALDAEELCRRLPQPLHITGPALLEEEAS
jgi:UDP-N-acetylglucosamine/UDP-N-acetylgalactosamine diphosphorylase